MYSSKGITPGRDFHWNKWLKGKKIFCKKWGEIDMTMVAIKIKVINNSRETKYIQEGKCENSILYALL